MSTFNRAQVIDDNFVNFLKSWSQPPATHIASEQPVANGATLTGRDAVELLESQMNLPASRLDRPMAPGQRRGILYDRIGGARRKRVVGRATRHTDPASCIIAARLCRRAIAPSARIDIIYDIVLSQAASAEDPIAGGRHKVWGRSTLDIAADQHDREPASQGRRNCDRDSSGRHLGVPLPIPDDSIVVCSFGDATVNHSTAQARSTPPVGPRISDCRRRSCSSARTTALAFRAFACELG